MNVEKMKMKVGVFFIALFILGSLGAYLYAGSSNNGSGKVAEGGLMYPFVPLAFAQGASLNITFLEEEAGMSIYVNVGQSIDLSVAKTVFKTIEKETSEYIIGSLSLPNLPESEDVHCFVHKDGWIVVYYLKAEPISKIIDWNYYNSSANHLTKTKLQVGLEQMGNASGVTVTNAKYYNFQYPNATKWMIIIEHGEGGTDSFNLKIPGEFTIYERSWSHYGSLYAYFKINGTTIDYFSTGSTAFPMTRYGTLTPTQLSPDVFYSVSTSGVGTHGVSIVLAYKES